MWKVGGICPMYGHNPSFIYENSLYMYMYKNNIVFEFYLQSGASVSYGRNSSSFIYEKIACIKIILFEFYLQGGKGGRGGNQGKPKGKNKQPVNEKGYKVDNS